LFEGAGIGGASQASRPPPVLSSNVKIRNGRDIIILKLEVKAFRNKLLF
jgi:hypothetical protein